MATINPFDFFLEPEAEAFPFTYDPILEEELAPYRKTGLPGPELLGLLAAIPPKADKTVDLLVEINRMLAARIAYIVRLEPGIWSPEETLGRATGSCRDSAWVLVNLLRHLGFAARFVSGYLIQLVADQKPVEGPAGPDHRLHRSPCLGRGLPARRRLDRLRRNLRPHGRRGPYPARRQRRPDLGRADLRPGREMRDDLRLRDGRDAHQRDPAHDQAL